MREGRVKWDRIATARVMQQAGPVVSGLLFKPGLEVHPGDLLLFSQREPSKVTLMRRRDPALIPQDAPAAAQNSPETPGYAGRESPARAGGSR